MQNYVPILLKVQQYFLAVEVLFACVSWENEKEMRNREKRKENKYQEWAEQFLVEWQGNEMIARGFKKRLCPKH